MSKGGFNVFLLRSIFSKNQKNILLSIGTKGSVLKYVDMKEVGREYFSICGRKKSKKIKMAQLAFLKKVVKIKVSNKRPSLQWFHLTFNHKVKKQ